MKEIVKLVTEWSAFEEGHPEAKMLDFCRFQLADKGGKEHGDAKMANGNLLRIIGRISSAYALYHRAAMADIGLPSAESFYYLNGINYHGEMTKTNLINFLFAETTTGMAAINSLIKLQLVKERTAPGDKRAKLVILTEKGRKKLAECYRLSSMVSEMIFKDVPADTILLCSLLMKGIEAKHSKLAVELKGQPFEEMYNAVMNK